MQITTNIPYSRIIFFLYNHSLSPSSSLQFEDLRLVSHSFASSLSLGDYFSCIRHNFIVWSKAHNKGIFYRLILIYSMSHSNCILN
ncbi:hypothetical protein HanIR_Chr04g0157691 [Helianthus annuus]|nr:hypothetical protein HanIR_Chr04g0157691 [Helianthus annuus]